MYIRLLVGQISKYLNELSLHFDEEEFVHQFSTHPEYPSLLAISDTLTFLNIKNVGIKVEKEDYHLLPEYFLAQLDGEQELFYIQNKNNRFTFQKNKKEENLSIEEFSKIFSGVLLLSEQEEQPKSTPKQKSIFTKIVVIAVSVLILFLILNTSIFVLGFSLLSFVGVYLSILALRDIFSIENKVISNFCSANTSLSCDLVLQSNKWKIFEKISFSDLSLVFFSSQLLGLFFFGLAKGVESYLFIQKIVLFGAIPIIGISLYYQKMVEKKWCPICLMISGVLILEMVFFLTFIAFKKFEGLKIEVVLLYFFTFILVIFLWIPLKNTLINLKEFKEKSLKLTRFSRNYDLFKNTLLKTEKKDFNSNQAIVLGTHQAKLQISVVTSPYCGHCKEAHEILHHIANKFKEYVQINIFYNRPIGKEEEQNHLFRSLIFIYKNQGQEKYVEEVNQLYDTKNYNQYKTLKIENTQEIDEMINNHAEVCFKNQIHFTPAIYINGYEFPKMYERKELEFFILDLIGDEFIN